MVFPERTKKDGFNQSFLLTLQYQGQSFESLDELAEFVKNERSKLNFFDFELRKVESLKTVTQVWTPFSYIISKQGSKRISNYERIGFKVDEEDIFRIGPPHFEFSTETACVGTRDGYRLYESPEKKYHLLTYLD